jgi:hypothetical protein
MERSVLGGAGLLETQLMGDQHSSTGTLLRSGSQHLRQHPELEGIDESSIELKTSDGVSKYRELLETARDHARVAFREESAERSVKREATAVSEGGSQGPVAAVPLGNNNFARHYWL